MLLKNGWIVRPEGSFQGDLRISAETIQELGPQLAPQPGEEVLDCTGLLLLPGGVETHTHLQLESMGTVTADSFATGTRAALFGGTTTVLDFATQFHGESMAQGLAHWDSKTRGNLFCDVSYHMALTEWNEALRQEMPAVVAAGYPSFKMYMAYKNNMMVRDEEIDQALRMSASLGAVIGFHCENGDLIEERVKALAAAGKRSPYWHAVSRPAELEREAIERLETIALLNQAPHYVVHLSTAMGLEAIQRARLEGSPVVVETCPQYLLLDDSLYGSPEDSSFEAARYIMSPPLRDKANQAALWAGLANGDIQFVGTDHCSFRMADQKTLGQGDFRKIPNGAPGIESRLRLLYTYGVVARRFSLERFAAVTAENAAKYFGLYPRKGVLAPGSDADVVVLDPRPLELLHQADLHEAVDYTPYEGMEVRGAVREVFLRGQHLIRAGALALEQPQGQILRGHAPDTRIR